MARQTSFVTFQGSIGEVTFYNTSEGPRARQKGGVSKARIASDPNYELTRQNNQEFGTASHTASLLKTAVRNSLVRAADSSFHSRFVSKLSEVVKKDPDSDRGERIVTPENLSILAGFRLNKTRSLASTLNCFFEARRMEKGILFTFEDLSPSEFKAPDNATHFRFFAEGVAVELEEEEYDRVDTESDYIPMELNPGSLSFTLAFESETFPHQIFVIGIEFFKIAAGKPYVVAKRRYNCAEFV
ncbi:hypothetical protein [Litoribacter populi]|uniref:hypothetical protein n=1 Tax=Litoribacter populi TaxID=2598460 RepID=UPI00117DA45E|nr:hypothetical protein [Litoribacter populi]